MKRQHLGIYLISSMLVLLGLFVAQDQKWVGGAQAPSRPDRLREQVAAIVSGKDSSERAMAITRQLSALNLAYEKQSFETQTRTGTNIVVDLVGNGHGTIMVGAHYDRVAFGEGAVDNAASCAMLLELLRTISKSPLKNRSLRAAFFDLEELGLLGSKAYVESLAKSNLPNAYLNFDIFAYGDTLYVLAPRQDAPLAKSMRQAADELKFPVRLEPKYPPSDHLSFMHAGVPTLGVSLIDGPEIDGVIQVISGGRGQGNSGKRPRIFEIIHTPNDKLDKVDPAAIDRALPIIERTLRQVDEDLPVPDSPQKTAA